MTKPELMVSVVARLKNNADRVEAFVRETEALLRNHYPDYEIILVDDGSTDGTTSKVSALLKDVPHLRWIRFTRDFGTDLALSAGLETAIGDYVVTVLPESDPISMIPALIEQCRRENKELLLGVHPGDLVQGPMRWMSDLFYRITRSVLQVDMLQHATHFQIYSRQALNMIVRMREKTRYLRLLGTAMGYRHRTFMYKPLANGAPLHRSWSEAFRLALGLLTAQSANPLRFVSLLGLFASLVNLLYVGYVVLVYVFKAHVAEGWTTLSLQTAGMFFCVFLILTVLSEYIGHILAELKDRPLYYALEEKTSSAVTPDPERRNIKPDL